MRIGNDGAAVPTDSAVESSLDVLLESMFWPKSLSFGSAYSRIDDDCDGQRGPEHALTVVIGQDGDLHVLQCGDNSLRFREPFGGGASPRVRNALLVLAEAIRRDNAVDHSHTEQGR